MNSKMEHVNSLELKVGSSTKGTRMREEKLQTITNNATVLFVSLNNSGSICCIRPILKED